MYNSEGLRYRAEIAEAYLEPIRQAGKRLRVRQAEMMEERERASGLTGIDYTRPFVMTAAYRDAVPDALVRLDKLESEYLAELEAVGAMRDGARARLEKMGGREASLLRLRYVSALPWITVAEGMGLAASSCKNMRLSALAEFYDYIPHVSRPPASRAVPQLLKSSTQ